MTKTKCKCGKDLNSYSQMKERIAMINHHRNSKGRSMLALISMIVLGFVVVGFSLFFVFQDSSESLPEKSV